MESVAVRAVAVADVPLLVPCNDTLLERAFARSTSTTGSQVSSGAVGVDLGGLAPVASVQFLGMGSKPFQITDRIRQISTAVGQIDVCNRCH